MTTTEEKMFQEAVAAIEAGNKDRAKDLLTRLLKENQENPDYWLWMSAVVESEKERRYCLKQTLKFDPENKMARRGLILLGDLPVDPSLVIPFEQQKRNWQLPPISSTEEPLPKPPWVKIGLATLGFLAAITLIIMAVNSDRLWVFRSRNIAAMGTAVPTPTYPASATPTITLTPRIIEPTAPWNILVHTYTPTPIYVYTPHPIVEAFSIAMRNYQEEDWSEAITYLNQAIQNQSDSPDLYYHLGEIYLRTGDPSNAQSAFEASINLDPDFAPGYFGRAKLNSLYEDQNEDVIDDLLTSVALDPEYGEAYLLLVQAFIKEGDTDKARENLEQVEIFLPDTPLLDLAKARLALSDGNFNQAIEYTEISLEKDLTLLEAYKFLGEIYQASDNVKASLDPLIIYYRYNTTYDPQIEILLTNAYAANERFEEAIQLLDEILEKDPGYAKGFSQRGVIYTQMGEFEKAFNDFSTAFKLMPKSFENCIILSEANFPLNKPGNAYQKASECQKLATSDEDLAHMYFVRALALEALENDVAKRDWERMLELEPDAVKPEWKATAEAFLNTYYTPTPTASNTPSPTQNTTLTVSKTSTVRQTLTSTITPQGD